MQLISFLFYSILFFTTFTACNSNESPISPDIEPSGWVSKVDSSQYNKGILLYNADQGKQFWTEFNTQIRPFWEDESRPIFQRKYYNENPYLECTSNGLAGSFGLRMSVFKTFFDDKLLPPTLASQITGIRFSAVGLGNDTFMVSIKNSSNQVISEEQFSLEEKTVQTYSLNFDAAAAKEIVFYSHSITTSDSLGFGIDDVYFITNENKVFTPPQSDAELLNWLKKASFNFFYWNYEELSNEKGIVLESYEDAEKISLSGIGFAYAVYIIAMEQGYISAELGKTRIQSMLNWQYDQNWFDGSSGWHGFPHHYFKKDGSAFWKDVSTIDWAICAAGIRVVKSYYKDDQTVTSIADSLLNRAKWEDAIDTNNKIVMGFNGDTGVKNDYRWALAFSEETELIYLEAVASKKLSPDIFSAIIREEKNGFYPSWFGAGFTYNWLQLWTGPIVPFKTNSIAAYQNDAQTSLQKFGIPIMGLTACETLKEIDENGFYGWQSYISNQGGSIRLTNGSVIQISPATYGATLALPFVYDNAIEGLKAFINLGFYHEYLGLPDNVRLTNLPEGYLPAPNYNPFDINIGPLILSIEQVQSNKIGKLFTEDEAIADALSKLIESFPKQ